MRIHVPSEGAGPEHEQPEHVASGMSAGAVPPPARWGNLIPPRAPVAANPAPAAGPIQAMGKKEDEKNKERLKKQEQEKQQRSAKQMAARQAERQEQQNKKGEEEARKRDERAEQDERIQQAGEAKAAEIRDIVDRVKALRKKHPEDPGINAGENAQQKSTIDGGTKTPISITQGQIQYLEHRHGLKLDTSHSAELKYRVSGGDGQKDILIHVAPSEKNERSHEAPPTAAALQEQKPKPKQELPPPTKGGMEDVD